MSSDTRVWPPFAARQNALAELERSIERNPEALDTQFYYASFLRDHGRIDDAVRAFEAIARAAPDHMKTLLALGVALARAGRRDEARARFERAVEIDATDIAALLNLANHCAFDDPQRGSRLFQAALERDPENELAHRGLCSLAAMNGDTAGIAAHRNRGYASGAFVSRRYFGATMPTVALALVSTDGGNTPIDLLLDPAYFHVTEVYVEAHRGGPLPLHDLIINTIGDADRSASVLHQAATLLAGERTRVINHPASVSTTGRIANAARFAGIDGVVSPHASAFTGSRNAASFPFILRVPGLHMGRGMELVRTAAELDRARQTLGSRDGLLAIPYVDTRSPDGAWRKYRVMCVGGKLFPLHLAIGERWDVHYFSAAMWTRADFRAEEQRFLDDPIQAIGTGGWRALECVAQRLGLEYAGIDFGLDAAGRVVIFEANAAMSVLAPDPEAYFSYRLPAFETIRAEMRTFFALPAGRTQP